MAYLGEKSFNMSMLCRWSPANVIEYLLDGAHQTHELFQREQPPIQMINRIFGEVIFHYIFIYCWYYFPTICLSVVLSNVSLVLHVQTTQNLWVAHNSLSCSRLHANQTFKMCCVCWWLMPDNSVRRTFWPHPILCGWHIRHIWCNYVAIKTCLTPGLLRYAKANPRGQSGSVSSYSSSFDCPSR